MTEHTIYSTLLWSTFAMAFFISGALLIIDAPYGRFMRTGFGPVLPSVYGWIIMESVASLPFFYFFFASQRRDNPVLITFLFLWQFHYLYRAFIYPFTRKGWNKPMPISIVFMGMIFNSANTYLNGRWLFTLGPEYSTDWFLDIRFIAGLLLFWGGLVLNRHSDHLLRLLRKPGDNSYHIPHRGFFRFVSMPNYLGEIVQWFGWALATWSLGGFSFAVFTSANLVPRACIIHRWYKEHFTDYPKKRRALIPFIL